MEPSSLWSMITKITARLGNLRAGDPRFDEGNVYTVWHVVRIHLFLLWKRISSNVFYGNLLTEKGFRRRYRLPTHLISHSQFKQRRKTLVFVRALLEFLRYSASRALQQSGPEEVRVLAMDLTGLRSDQYRDPYGAWGYSSDGGFFGYKLGLITTEHGIVLGMTLMKANWTELRVNRKLLRLARETLEMGGDSFEVHYVVCDSGFDGESTFEAARRELGAWALCPPRRRRNPKAQNARRIRRDAQRRSPHRFRAQLLLEMPQIREIFHKRVEIERINGQMKDDPLSMGQMPRCRRPLRLLLALCLGKAILYNCCLIVNAERGTELRRIKHVLAS